VPTSRGRRGATQASSRPEPAPTAPLTVAAVARRLGVAPATLRTWDRRYGIGPTEHAAGSRRRYTPDDVARLDEMRRLTRSGVTPAEAAREALSGRTSRGGRGGRTGGARRGGGRALRLPDADERVRGLANAAMALDAAGASATVRSALAEHGVVPTWDELLVPVLTAIGDRWEATRQGVDVEHLLSECVIGALAGATSRLGRPTGRPVLLASAPEEMHALPLHALAAALAERGAASRLLGARVPPDALAAAYQRIGPPALFVWSQSPATGRPGLLADLPEVRPRPALVVGGSGWPEVLPAGVARAATLADARDRLLTAVA
jgi:MerR family transcriptional regulator, light-induced transcriptional regulator